MLRKIFILIFLFSILSCQNKNSENITSKVDNNIVGDFDREKYPLIQKAIELGFDEKRE